MLTRQSFETILANYVIAIDLGTILKKKLYGLVAHLIHYRII